MVDVVLAELLLYHLLARCPVRRPIRMLISPVDGACVHYTAQTIFHDFMFIHRHRFISAAVHLLESR